MIWLMKSTLMISFLASLVLILFHYISPWLAKQLPAQGKAFISFAAGTSVAYVFLDMLPNLVEYNKPIGQFLIENFHLTRLTELAIYICTLLGFGVFYGLDLVAQSYQKNDNRLYLLHLLMFCLYNFLITYTMSLRADVSVVATMIFTATMALHFVLSDQKFCRLYPHRFNHVGRFILILALLLGWLFSVIFDPVNVLVLAFLTSFLAGSVLFNVFREELPSSTLSSYPWFLLGAFVISMCLLTYNLVLQEMKIV
jgi:hypothetical protein